jgi:hypothetical protein
VTYENEINELRREIDAVDREIIKRISNLSQVIKKFERRSSSIQDYNLSNIGKMANEHLDSKNTSRIFEEISNLLNTQELNS